jgi:hypothetical protein
MNNGTTLRIDLIEKLIDDLNSLQPLSGLSNDNKTILDNAIQVLEYLQKKSNLV